MPNLWKALQEGTTTAGGYLVPDEFARQVYAKITQEAKAIPDCGQINMHSDVMYLPTVTTGSTARWVGENATITSADLAFGQVTLTARKVAALVPVSTELLEDSNPDVAALVVDQMAKDLALSIDTQILRGTQSASTGFLGYTEHTLVNKVTASATTGDAITLAKIASAVTEGETDGFHYDTMYIHPRTLGVIRQLTDSTGRFMFNQEQSGEAFLKTGVVGEVFGLKVKPTTAISITVTKSTTTTATDVVVVESKKCGLYGTRRGMQMNKFYQIDTDDVKLQTNLRSAFSVLYPDAVCVIEDILS